jgi:FkbM family methyltransferase
MPDRATTGHTSNIEVWAKARYHLLTRWIFLRYRFLLSFTFRIRNLLRRMAPLPFSVGGFRILLRPQGAVAFNVWTQFQVERQELELMLRAVDKGMVFFDVGSNIGLFSLVVGKKLADSAGAVYSFEPCTETCAIFRHNLCLNHLMNVHLIEAALTDRVGEATLRINAGFLDGLNTLGKPTHSDCRIIGSQRVATTTIDDFVFANNIKQVDVIKIDAEGAELLVLRGARKLLEGPEAPLILYEGFSWCTAGFDYRPEEIAAFLEQFRYEFFLISSIRGALALRRADQKKDQMIVAVRPGDRRFSGLFQRPNDDSKMVMSMDSS